MKIYAIANYVRQYGGHGEDSTEEAMIRVVHPLFESREEAEEYLASLGKSSLAFITELEPLRRSRPKGVLTFNDKDYGVVVVDAAHAK